MRIEEAINKPGGVAFDVNGHYYINMNKEHFLECLEYSMKLSFDTLKKKLPELNKLLGFDYKEFVAFCELSQEFYDGVKQVYSKVSGNAFALLNNVYAKKEASSDKEYFYFIRDGMLSLTDEGSFEAILKQDSVDFQGNNLSNLLGLKVNPNRKNKVKKESKTGLYI